MNRLLTIAIMLISAQLMAHGPIHEKIDLVNKKIKRNPSDATLYIERSSYYKIDAQFDMAMADLVKARSLDATITTVDFLAADLCYVFENYNMALAHISAFQALNMDLGECYLLKSKILDKLFMSDSALHYAKLSYNYKQNHNTTFFAFISELTLYADKDNYDDAIGWLMLGKKHLPYDIVLQEKMVDLAVKYSKYDQAVKFCNEQLPKLKRKEKWFFKLALVHNAAGDKEQALFNLEQSKKSIEQLPKHFRTTDFIKNLVNEINKLTDEIKLQNDEI
ncbi:MAG: hypothetical protein JXR19_07390 [Bacteroidia bacterium]